MATPGRGRGTASGRSRHLNPLLQVGVDAVVLDTAAIGAVPVSELRKAVANLRDARAAVHEALDTLFGAY